MEAFSLLKYWRNSGAGNGGEPDASPTSGGGTNLRTSSNSTTTIVTAVSSLASETDEDEGNDDGPFFDLEFAVPDEEEVLQHSKTGDTDDDEDVETDEPDENELKFTLSSGSSGDCTDPNVTISPSDGLFFKGRLVPFEHSSTDLNGSLSENNPKLQFPVSLMKSATKFRVMMLKLKKSTSNVSENAESKTLKKDKIDKLEAEKEGKEHSKPFMLKFKATEVPTVSSLFVNSSKNSASSKPPKENIEVSEISDEKRFSKETVQKYLKNVKLRFSGQLSTSGGAKDGIVAPLCTAGNTSAPALSNEKESTPETKDTAVGSNVKNAQKQGNVPAGLRVMYKHLGKSRSASSATVAAAPPRAELSKRRDDSLLQQQDGIQGAILHCKTSFKASRDLDCSILERSVSADSSSGDKETSR